jgi:uncharacterized protein (TIGR00255 family)
MIKSMTGFGRGEYRDEARTITAEIRAVNHRYSEISIRMPRRFSFAEDRLRSLVKDVAARGKIDVFINVTSGDAEGEEVQLNMELAESYYSALKKIGERFGELPADISVRNLALMPDVLKIAPKEEDEEAVFAMLSEAMKAALENFDAMRAVEGEKLAADMLYRNDLIEKTVLEIEKYAPSVAENYTQKMKERIQELLGDGAVVPEDRILLEAAVFADKSNITEEIVRLKSHIAQMRSICKDPAEPIGKKLDFLVQEMNRESNTIGSKANDINITNNVLVLKAEIEKIREQVQNIE